MTDVPKPPRRNFLKWCCHGLGAVFAVLLGAPAIAYLVDARNRTAGQGAMRKVTGVRREEMQKNVPVQGVVRDLRRDAWTLHPDDVIGRVWVVKLGDGNSKSDYQVFTTVCPHLGCSVNANPDATTGFTCPCHNGQYHADGTRVVKEGYENPAPRGMDSLEFEFDPHDSGVFLVHYQNFRQTLAEKVVRT
jgi:Rieske Fe-S protein